MKLLTRTVSANSVSSGKALTVTIPAAFAREMNIKKSTKLKVTYNPDSNSLTVSK